MRISESFDISDKTKVSLGVRNGVIDIRDIHPTIESLKFSWMDLSLLNEIRDHGIDIDMERWLDLLKKEQKLMFSIHGLLALKDTLAYDIEILGDDSGKREINFIYNVSGYEDYKAQNSINDFNIKFIKEKAYVIKTTHFDENNQWKIVENDLVSVCGGVEVKIKEDIKKQIFSMIEKHVNEHIDAFEKLLEKRLEKYSAFNVVYKKEVQERLFELTREYDAYHFSDATREDWKELKNKLSKEFTEIFGIQVNVE